MATTENCASLQEKDCFRLLKEYRRYRPELTSDALIVVLVKAGVVDASILLELVHAEEYELVRDSRNGRDFTDKSNSKLCCAYSPLNAEQSTWGYRFKVKNCEGDVLVRFSNPYHEEVYGGRIPHAEVKGKHWLVITDCVKGGVKAGKYGKYIIQKY